VHLIGPSHTHKVFTDANKVEYSSCMCKKALSHQSELKIHPLVHNAECPFYCDICDKALSLHINLKRQHFIHTG
jgi:hypothetical protein